MQFPGCGIVSPIIPREEMTARGAFKDRKHDEDVLKQLMFQVDPPACPIPLKENWLGSQVQFTLQPQRSKDIEKLPTGRRFCPQLPHF